MASPTLVGVPARHLLIASLIVVVLLSDTVAVLYVVGQQGCPPPDWAFWRYTEGDNGFQNFACVAR